MTSHSNPRRLLGTRVEEERKSLNRRSISLLFSISRQVCILYTLYFLWIQFNTYLNTKVRYKRHFPRENMAQLSINLRGAQIKSNMAGDSNVRKVSQHEINTYLIFCFAPVKFRNTTATEYIFSFIDYNTSGRIVHRGTDKLAHCQWRRDPSDRKAASKKTNPARYSSSYQIIWP